MKNLILIFIFMFTPLLVSAEVTHEQQWIVIDCQEDTDLAAAQTLADFSQFSDSEVEQAKRVLLMAEGADVRWRDDGTDPTASVGFELIAGATQPFFYAGNLKEIRFIEESTSSDLFACLYK